MTLMLLDSASLWYRAYYGMPDTFHSPSGEPINAVRGFLDMSARLISLYRPTRFIACIEGDWRPSWRVELFPGYKANRVADDGDEEEPETLTAQIPIILEILETFGFPVVGADDYEADDVIASYSHTLAGPTRIVTGDRDLFQLVDHARDVKVVYLAKGISNHDVVDESWIESKYEIPGERYAIFAMIRGDASDGLPGIKGIGEKGAAHIARNFSTIEELKAAIESESDLLTSAMRRKLLEDYDYLSIAPTLVHCARDVRLPALTEKELALPRPPASMKRIEELKKRYGIGTSIDRLISVLQW